MAHLGASLLAGLLLVFAAACGSSERIVYVDNLAEAEALAAAAQPIGRSASPRVHADGVHEMATEITIGGAADTHTDAPYTPIASSHGPLVHGGAAPHPTATVTLAHERPGAAPAGQAAGSATLARPAPAAVPPTPATRAAAAATPAAAAWAIAPPRSVDTRARAEPAPAASPTAPTHLSLGASLEGPVPTPGPRVLLAADADDELAVVAGPVASVAGQMLTVQTRGGPKQVRLSTQTRVEGEERGSLADLRPGQFVGAVQAPGGPARLVRLYNPGPSTPRAGVVPMLGAEQGQVTAFGSIVSLQPGGMVVHTGGQTTAVRLPADVEVLRPAPATTASIGVNAQVIASGVPSSDGALLATGLRVTGEGPLAR